MDSRGGPGAPGDLSIAGRVDHWATVARSHPILVDAVLVGVLGGPLVLLGPGVGASETAMLPSFVLGVGMVLPLVWRRVAPLAVLATLCAVGAVQLLAAGPLGMTYLLPADAGFVVALYTVTARARTAVTQWVALPVGLGAALLCAFVSSSSLPVLVLAVLVAVVSGTLRRVRSAYVEGLVERAQGAELERVQQVHLAESAERARIAREMHDVVAHSLSVIIVQADGGSYAARQDPGRAVEVLGTIAATGREALTQMRQLLGVLREDPSPGSSVPTTPQPGLAELPALVDRIAATGLPVHADLAGTTVAADIPQATGLVGYRVVQESLTNVLKHAGRVGRVDVTVERIRDRLRIEVSDDGRGAAASLGGPVPVPGAGSTGAGSAGAGATTVLPGPPAAGQGLRGMRERVALLGGRLVAGPRPGGGFRTVATLPVPLRDGRSGPVPGWVRPAGRPAPGRDPRTDPRTDPGTRPRTGPRTGPVRPDGSARPDGPARPVAVAPSGETALLPPEAAPGGDAWTTWEQQRGSGGRRGRGGRGGRG